MNPKCYLLLICFFLAQYISAQCPPGNISFNTQAAIDNFIINYPNCTDLPEGITIEESSTITNLNGLQNLNSIGWALTIENNDALTNLEGLENLNYILGWLVIDGNVALTNLTGLQNLDSIGFDLAIFNSSLISLTGLENLKSVGRDIYLEDNDALTSLTGLENLHSVGRDIYLEHYDALTSLTGLENLNTVGGDLRIWGNDALTSLTGLENLGSVGGNLNISGNSITSLTGLDNLNYILGWLAIEGNYALTSLTGLENLNSVGGRLRIGGNYALTSLTGLENLNTIGEDLRIWNNEPLTSLVGLENLTSISGDLIIKDNDGLTSLAGMENLTSIGGDIEIRKNDILSVCSTPPICKFLLNSSGSNVINNNAPGCNDALEILDNCWGIGEIYYPLFYDLNENGFKETYEPFLPQASVFIEPVDLISYGNSTNGGLKRLYFGDYTVAYNENATPLWELTTSPDFIDFTLDTLNYVDTVYFGLYPTANISDVKVMMANSQPRCNEFVTFEVMAINDGTTVADGTLWFTVDENILDANYIDPPDTLVSPNRYGWHFTDLYPGQVIKKQISLQLPGPPGFPIGELLTFESQVFYSDINGPNGSDKLVHSFELLCAYDPNDKLVQPVFPNNYALIGEDLVYSIRFQNTGNAEAYDVVIKDLLDPNLDLNSFRYIASSHESVLSTYLKGNQLTFEFRNIFLPDSTTNFDESQGYVMYSIRAKDDIDEETIIDNTANIFFDFNPAVITNTTENVMLSTFDFDQDGFELWNDCDDTNENINPDTPEIPYNGFDDDCDEVTLDDDLDQDGFGIDEDCNDNYAFINPGTPEIPYNGFDDDCDEATLDDDLDQDGFGIDEDCDDQNDSINPNAEEIPNNGIDEDCDGEDLIVSTNHLEKTKPQIFPNPTSDHLQIIFPESIKGNYELRDLTGKLLIQSPLRQNTTIDLNNQAQGVYILLIKTEYKTWIKRIVKI